MKMIDGCVTWLFELELEFAMDAALDQMRDAGVCVNTCHILIQPFGKPIDDILGQRGYIKWRCYA